MGENLWQVNAVCRFIRRSILSHHHCHFSLYFFFFFLSSCRNWFPGSFTLLFNYYIVALLIRLRIMFPSWAYIQRCAHAKIGNVCIMFVSWHGKQALLICLSVFQQWVRVRQSAIHNQSTCKSVNYPQLLMVLAQSLPWLSPHTHWEQPSSV